MLKGLKHSLLLALALSFMPTGAASAFAAPLPAPQQAASQDTLYKRLGGYDAIAAVTDDFITRLVTDPKESRFFVGLSTDSKTKVRQHLVDFLCVATGGPCKYTGRDMATAHTGLGITEEDWSITVKLLGDTLNKFQVPATASRRRDRTTEESDRRPLISSNLSSRASILCAERDLGEPRDVSRSLRHQILAVGSLPL